MTTTITAPAVSNPVNVRASTANCGAVWRSSRANAAKAPTQPPAAHRCRKSVMKCQLRRVPSSMAPCPAQASVAKATAPPSIARPRLAVGQRVLSVTAKPASSSAAIRSVQLKPKSVSITIISTCGHSSAQSATPLMAQAMHAMAAKESNPPSTAVVSSSGVKGNCAPDTRSWPRRL
ncbi:hypothetical protein D3C76_1189480 [compost metagenome]